MASDSQFLTLLEKERPNIEAFLPSYLRTADERDRFFANARAVSQNYLLKDCNANSLLNCVVDAAKRGLMIGGPDKHCAVVPFDTKNGGKFAVLITQWQGKSFLWFRAGAIKKLKAGVVYKGDKFALIEGDEDRIDHQPDYETDRSPEFLNNIDNIIGSYAIAWLANGERIHRFVSRSYLKRLMETVKKKNNGKLGFGWQDWLPEMCTKTAVHRLDGLIQPQVGASDEQKEAWVLSTRIPDEEHEVYPTSEDPDPPTPRKAKNVEIVKDAKPPPPGDGSSARKQEERPPASTASTADDPISEEDQDDVYTAADAKWGKKSASHLMKILKDLGADDVAAVKQCQLQSVINQINLNQ